MKASTFRGFYRTTVTIALFTLGSTFGWTASALILKQWDVSLGGSDVEGGDFVPMVKTSDGGYFVAGFSRSGISGSKSTGNFGNEDAWVVRLDANGTKLWDRSFGGTGRDVVSGMALTSDGGCVIGGSSNSDPSGNKTSAHYGGHDFWMLRLDANGNKVWEASFGGNNEDQVNSLEPTPDGGFIVGGYSESPTSGNKTSPYYGDHDFWVIKLDGNGNKVWENAFGGSGAEVLNSMLATSDGYFLGGGATSGTSGNKSSPNYGGDDFWLVKLDTDGNKLWDQSYGGTLSDRVYSIVPASAEGYLLGGISKSDISGTKTTPNYGSYDYWLVRIDPEGNALWDASFGGDFGELFGKIVPATDGTFLLAGASDSGISGTKVSPNRGIAETADAWVVGVDSSGNKIWEETFGGNSGDHIRSAIATGDGTYALAGLSASDISGNKTSANFGNGDLWVLNFTVQPACIPEILIPWEVTLGGSEDDYATAILQTSDGGYLVSGNSRSGISGNKTTANNGDYDMWVVRLDANGQKVWEQVVGAGGTDTTYANTMVLTSDGGCVVGGSFNNTGAWAVRLDAGGNVLWDNKYGGRGAFLCLVATPDGGFIVGSSTEGDAPGKTSPFYGGVSDFWVLRLDADGNKLWETSFGGAGDEYPYSIVATPDGYYLLGGFSNSDVSGNKTSFTFGEGDFWLVKFDSNGNKLWDQSYGGPLAERLYSIAPTSDGGYLLGGLAATVVANDPPINGVGDYWIVKIDSAGNLLWNRSYGGEQHELFSKIVAGNDGTFLVAGTSFSDVSGNKASPNRGSADYWVVSIDSGGDKLWEESFGGDVQDNLFSAVLTSDGGYALAGTSLSGISGNKTTPNHGAGDYWVLKVSASCPSVVLMLNCPGDLTQPADPGQCSAVVNFEVTTSGGSGNTSIACTPASGAAFARGTTTVTCTASDSAGQTATCFFNVTVNDMEAPYIICPANVNLSCSVNALEPAIFSASATDNCDASPTVICSPASGSGFAVGVTTVTCTATDTSRNQSTCHFTVTRGALEFTGFLTPIGGADGTGGSFEAPLRTFKLNSTIPIKFTAACGGSAVLTGTHRLQVIKYTDATTAGDPIDATPTDAATMGDEFRLSGTQWHFNLDIMATGMSVGTWLVRATLSDGSQHTAWIQIK